MADTETPMSEQQRTQMQSQYDRDTAYLRDRANDNRPAAERLRVIARVGNNGGRLARDLRLREAAAAKAQSDEARVEELLNPDDRTARIQAKVTETKAAIAMLPVGDARIAKLIADQAALTRALRDTTTREGTFTHQDLRSQTTGLSDVDHDNLVRALFDRGLAPAEQFRFLTALREASIERDLDADEMERRLERWYPDEAARSEKYSHADRGFEALPKTVRLLLSPRRGNPRVIEELARLGKKLGA